MSPPVAVVVEPMRRPGQVFATHGTAQTQSKIANLKARQGIPISERTPALLTAVSCGLLRARSVQRPDKTMEPFGFLHYIIGIVCNRATSLGDLGVRRGGPPHFTVSVLAWSRLPEPYCQVN